MMFNKSLTAEEIGILYHRGNGTETIPGDDYLVADYTANGWSFDTSEDFEVKVDFHYSNVNDQNGGVGINVGNNDGYVSVSAGSDTGASYFYYETYVGGSPVSNQELRDSNDGTLYISFDADLNDLYLSRTGFGIANAYLSQTIPDSWKIYWHNHIILENIMNIP